MNYISKGDKWYFNLDIVDYSYESVFWEVELWLFKEWRLSSDLITLKIDNNNFMNIKSDSVSHHSINLDNDYDYFDRKLIINGKYQASFFGDKITFEISWNSAAGGLAVYSLKSVFFAECPSASFYSSDNNDCSCNQGFGKIKLKNCVKKGFRSIFCYQCAPCPLFCSKCNNGECELCYNNFRLEDKIYKPTRCKEK